MTTRAHRKTLPRARQRGILVTQKTLDIPQAIPLAASLAPTLPAYARLTDEQVVAARQTGQWLDAFVAFASIASPLTPPAFHLAAGIFLGGVAIARRLYLDLNSSTKVIYPNLYLLYVGPSCRLTL